MKGREISYGEKFRLKAVAKHFRVLKDWDIQMEDDPDNHGCCWGGRGKVNQLRVGTWDEKMGPEPVDYLLHEVLHGVLISLVKMDKRRPKEQRQAEELIVQDLCAFIKPYLEMSAEGKGG